VGEGIGNIAIRATFDGSQAGQGLSQLTGELAKFGNDTEKHMAKFQELGSSFGIIGNALAGFAKNLTNFSGMWAKLTNVGGLLKSIGEFGQMAKVVGDVHNATTITGGAVKDLVGAFHQVKQTAGLGGLVEGVKTVGTEAVTAGGSWAKFGAMASAAGGLAMKALPYAAIAAVGAAAVKAGADFYKMGVEANKAFSTVENIRKQQAAVAEMRGANKDDGPIGKAGGVLSAGWEVMKAWIAELSGGAMNLVEQLTGVGAWLDSIKQKLLNMLPSWMRESDETSKAKAEAKKIAELNADADKSTATWKSQLESRLTKVEQLRKQWQEIEKRIQEEMRRTIGAPNMEMIQTGRKLQAGLVEDYQKELADQAAKAAEEERKRLEEQERIAEKLRTEQEKAANAIREAFQKWESDFLSVATESESMAYNLQKQFSELANAQAMGDQFGATVAQRRIGKLGASLMANVPEFRQVDPFAGVSLAGSQEAYRDTIRSMFPPEQLSIQERMAEGIEEMNRKSDEELAIQEEVLRVMQGQAGPRLAHLVN
jgi:hypothetical protein